MDKRMKYLVIGALASGLTVAGAVSGGLVALPGAAAVNGIVANGLEAPAPEFTRYAEFKQIDAPVATDFGTYSPYPVPRYQPMVGLDEPTVSAGFGNVATGGAALQWSTFFSQRELAMLRDNSFVARPEPIGTFAQAYVLDRTGLPPFVTTDAVMHGLRITLDEAYREYEHDQMVPMLQSLLGEVAKNIESQLDAGPRASVATDLSRALAYVQTAQTLLDPSREIDPRVRKAVSIEIDRITSGAGVQSSVILPTQRVDYAAFVPTGHYTLDDTFRRLYQARTWLQRVGFALRSNGAVDVSTARSAMLLARTMDVLAEDPDFADTYRGIIAPMGFFEGVARTDMSWDMLGGAERSYLGTFEFSNTSSFADDATIREFVPYLENDLPSEVVAAGSTFRLLGRTYDPGEWLDDQIRASAASGSQLQGVRLMAAMGSQTASRIVNEKSDASTTLASRPVEERVQSLGAATLYTLEPLLETPTGADTYSAGYPRFMRSAAWRQRELVSALGAWADYRDPMQSIPMSATNAAAGTAGPVGAGYVEPNPEAWGRIAALAGYVRSGFESDRFGASISRDLLDKLKDVENSAARLMRIAAAELESTPLTADQSEFVATMPQRIAAYATFAHADLKGDGTPAVVDASTAGPATGLPMAIYAIVPRNDASGGLMLVRGAIYSYYETDAAAPNWVQTLTSGSSGIAPDRRLIGSFVAATDGFSQPASQLRSVAASLPSVANYHLTERERKQILPTVGLSLESNVARRSSGELWFTVSAPNLSGAMVVINVVNSAGQTVYQSQPEELVNGQRQDLVQVHEYTPGQYFIRISDLSDRTLASGRFVVVQ